MGECERAAIYAELTPPIDVRLPEGDVGPIVFSSPHSGRIYPKSFLAASRLAPDRLRRSEDCFVDELFGAAPAHGAPLLAARFPRAYLDVNREPYELDPLLFESQLPAYANTRSIRVLGGLGTIARIVSEADEIYREPPTIGAALVRIDRLYRPYHERLRGLLADARRDHGHAVLVDCHSMPSSNMGLELSDQSDIVLGDRFGRSCAPEITRYARGVLRDLGFSVALNQPYAGGFITEHYGRPEQLTHALQIEINRALYMNEETLEKSAAFGEVERALAAFVARLAAQRLIAAPARQAAE